MKCMFMTLKEESPMKRSIKGTIPCKGVGQLKNHLRLVIWLAATAASSVAIATDGGIPIDTHVLFVTNSTWAGDPIKYMKTKTPEVRVQTVEFAPGASTIWHYHPVPSYIYVISGTFQVETGDGRLQQFNAGQAFVEVVNTLHRGTNVGTEPTKLVIFYTGDGSPVVTLAPPPVKDKDKDSDND